MAEESSAKLKSFVGDSKFIVIDEAQRVQNIGLKLKILHDNFPQVQIAVTGSSALELSNTINEPFTGRKFEYNLFPFLTNDNIVSSYLYKDVFEFQNIRKPSVIEKLIQALALQTGSEVSFNELGNLLGIDTLTVQKYVDLLEKAYVIFHLHSYSKNVRNELKKSIKIYFYDNGVRNAVISNFSSCDLRSDIGMLWENFLISERVKNNAFHNRKAKYYFWRTSQKQEIDFITEG